MRPTLTNAYVTYLLSLLIALQIMVLMARIAAWVRWQRSQEDDQMREDDPRLVPKTKVDALVPVAASGYLLLVMIGGLAANWIARPAPLNLLVVLAVLVVPGLLADGILLVWQRLQSGKQQ